MVLEEGVRQFVGNRDGSGGAGALRTLKRGQEHAFHPAATSYDAPDSQV